MDIIRKDDPGAVKEDYFIRDYCALDVFCPQYEAAGCEEAWLREHGGSL